MFKLLCGQHGDDGTSCGERATTGHLRLKSSHNNSIPTPEFRGEKTQLMAIVKVISCKNAYNKKCPIRFILKFGSNQTTFNIKQFVSIDSIHETFILNIL